jgi:HAE1 family hydrophobic/amphiphilic exporter-1
MRPVLMTSATVILALFPAALGLGAGAETNQPLAIAVIGGMISSTLLTLVVVPAVYSLVENRLARSAR